MHNPQVPETLDGWSVLHQMFRIRWGAWKALPEARRAAAAGEAAALLAEMAQRQDGSTALVQILGHKADLMLVHFRRSFDDLAEAQQRIARSALGDHLEPTTSYVSVVELGLYEMTGKIHADLAARGLQNGGEEFDRAFDAEMAKQRERMIGRLFGVIPRNRYVCFYPMNKRRGEAKNWYSLPFEKRAALMREHGLIGRQYGDRVTQVISGSIGFDDWEWGVDLFADDPLVFKKLIYEMRFDEASADYAEFGPFYVGLQFAAPKIADLLEGRTPAL